MKIVDSGYKMDLHIHSVYSKGKDRGKVSFNTIENIGVLANKLTQNGIQICAITDHDYFDYEMYRALKKYENDDDCSLIKVFPRIEFSVEYLGDNGATELHVIAIFSDESEEDIQRITGSLVDGNGRIIYDKHMAFSEERFLSILRVINLDTILIVHQKNSLFSKKPKRNDANSVGDERFYEFIYTDYFEAYEFKNRKNEVFNKAYLNAHGLNADVRFVTGSDCHDWRVYPREDESDHSEFVNTYVKCLPSFRGLVMAMTDHRRIKTVNSFFNPDETYISSIELSVEGKDYSVPLSRGINVIIGDNSIGKSMLLHKLTGFRKEHDGALTRNIVKGYQRYLKSNNIEVITEITTGEVFAFDMQGEIRDKFEQATLKSDVFLKPYFPSEIKPEVYKEKILRKMNEVFHYLEEKFEIELKEEQLGSFRLLNADITQAESITFVGFVAKDNKRVEGYNDIVSELNNIIEKIDTLTNSVYLEAADNEQLQDIVEQLRGLSLKYFRKKTSVELENKKIALFDNALSKFKEQYYLNVTDMQKRFSAYNESIDKYAELIADVLYRKQHNCIPSLSITKENIQIQTERVHDYEFNSRLGITEIDEEYLLGLLKVGLLKSTKKSVMDMTQEELADNLSYYEGAISDALSELKSRILKQIDEDLSCKFTITQAGKDRTQELSAGLDAQIYFDLLAYESRRPGVYIIDQPEDNVSQQAIRDYLLDRFKTMGEHRQVIMVTHRPQFIVNLDVDNVIYLGKEDGEIVIKSGALEYRDNDYCVLDIISEHIEGGLDTLRRRWKRYEKNNRL